MSLKKIKSRFIIGFLVAVLAFVGLWILKSQAFVGPTASPPNENGIFRSNGKSLGVGGPAISTTTFTVYGSTTDNNTFGLRIEDSSHNPILRIRNDGFILGGNIEDSEIYNNPSYPLQARGVNAPFIKTDNLSTYNALVYSLLDGGGTAEIRDFQLIKGTTLSGSIGAANILAGIFSPGDFAFKGNLGVSTATVPMGDSYALTVDGDTYISGNAAIRMNIPVSGPGAINVKADPSANNWLSGIWSKAIRIENNGAIEFGGGTGGTLFGMGVRNNIFYIFNTLTETSVGTAGYNMAIGQNGIAIGDVDYDTVPEAVLQIEVPVTAPYRDGILIGRSDTTVSSIRAMGGSGSDNDLVLNSTSSGKIYLNNFHSGNIIIGTGGGKVGVGTSSPDATSKLDVAGLTKTQTIQITGGSPGAGKVLTATDANGSSTWQNSAIPSGAYGATLYHNGTAWIASTTSLYNNGSRVGIGTTNPLGAGTLSVTGGISVGTYAGSFTPPSGGLIVSGNVGIGTNTPTAKLEINHLDDSKALRLRGSVSSYVDLFAAVGNSTLRFGEELCRTKTDAGGAACIGYWNNTGTSVGCGSQIVEGRALCADAD